MGKRRFRAVKPKSVFCQTHVNPANFSKKASELFLCDVAPIFLAKRSENKPAVLLQSGRNVTSFKDVIRVVPLEFSFDCALAGNAMHIIYRAFFVVLCATFSASIQADDFVSVVDQNFPYDEVDESYGVAKIQEGRCEEGTPFQIVQDDSSTDTKMDVAKRIHEILRGMGANAFLITDLEEDTHVRNVTVTPLTCDLS